MNKKKKKGFKDFPSLHLEVQKRTWTDKETKIMWMLRVGDLTGSTQHLNITKEDMVQELVDEVNDYDEESK